MQLEGRVALVTGGAQGIGERICDRLAESGAAIAIVDLQVEKSRQLAERLASKGYQAIWIAADLADSHQCEQVVSQTLSNFGSLDILVNCAAPGRDRSMLGKISQADWPMHEQIVLQAVVHLAEAALPSLEASGRGTVVNISSVVANTVALDHCSWPYHVSKAGLNQLTRWLAARLGSHGVRVNAVAPGLVDRDASPRLTDNEMHRDIVRCVVPLGRAGNAIDVANAVVFLCSDLAAYITGQVLTVDGGLGLNDIFGASVSVYRVSGGPRQNHMSLDETEHPLD